MSEARRSDGARGEMPAEPLLHELSRAIPAGAGKTRGPTRDQTALDAVLRDGPRALGTGGDYLVRTASGVCLPRADPAAVSERARERGAGQLGTMGSGNH